MTYGELKYDPEATEYTTTRPEEETQVRREIGNIENEVSRLKDVVAHLEKRLHQVLTDAEPQEDKMPQTVPPVLVPLAAELRQRRIDLAELIERIIRITGRVEL